MSSRRVACGHDPALRFVDAGGYNRCPECAARAGKLGGAKGGRMSHGGGRPSTARTHCKAGVHLWTAENIYTSSDGRQRCLPCYKRRPSVVWRGEKEATAETAPTQAPAPERECFTTTLDMWAAGRPDPNRDTLSVLSPFFGMAGMLEMQATMGGR